MMMAGWWECLKQMPQSMWNQLLTSTIYRIWRQSIFEVYSLLIPDDSWLYLLTPRHLQSPWRRWKGLVGVCPSQDAGIWTGQEGISRIFFRENGLPPQCKRKSNWHQAHTKRMQLTSQLCSCISLCQYVLLRMLTICLHENRSKRSGATESQFSIHLL